MMEKIKKYFPSRRKIFQLYTALLYNANLKGFVSGKIYAGQTKQFCVPGLNCYSCPGAVSACPLGSLQGAFSADKSTLFYVCGIVLLYGILFGRMICGWLCPFGLIQELLYKIPTPKLKKSPLTRILSYLKYVILVFFVFIVPVTYAFRDTPLPAFCKYICPAGTLEGGLALLAHKANASYFAMLGPLFTWKFLILVSIVVSSVFAFRMFCRFLCPLGGLYGLFNGISLLGIQLDQPKCIDCGKCISRCRLDIRHVGDQECISCGECIAVCPTQAISFKGGRVFLRENEVPTTFPGREKQRRTVKAAVSFLMLAVLVGSLVLFWIRGDTPVSYGSSVGDFCYSYDLALVDSSGILDQTVDPTATGKVTIVNFWGTWCTPCIQELPYFDRIAADYADSVTVIAVHTHSVIETAPKYIASYYPRSMILFATDYPIDKTGLTGGYYTALGGRGTFPYTVILDEDGIIRNIFVDALGYEDLQQAVETILSE